MHSDIDELLAEREDRLLAELAELSKPTGEAGTISFGKRIGEGTSLAVDRLTAGRRRSTCSRRSAVAKISGHRRVRRVRESRTPGQLDEFAARIA
jgi:hypothetical protein